MVKPQILPAAVFASTLPMGCTAFSQTTTITQSGPTYPSEWPDAAAVLPGRNLLVVTLAKPAKRQKCHVRSFDENQLVCSRPLGRSPAVFDREQVSALIVPGYRPRLWLYDPIGAAFAGGSIYGAVILTGIGVFPAIGGIAMAVVVTFDALWFVGEANSEFGPDTVLYLKPGEQLKVSLECGS